MNKFAPINAYDSNGIIQGSPSVPSVYAQYTGGGQYGEQVSPQTRAFDGTRKMGSQLSVIGNYNNESSAYFADLNLAESVSVYIKY